MYRCVHTFFSPPLLPAAPPPPPSSRLCCRWRRTSSLTWVGAGGRSDACMHACTAAAACKAACACTAARGTPLGVRAVLHAADCRCFCCTRACHAPANLTAARTCMRCCSCRRCNACRRVRACSAARARSTAAHTCCQSTPVAARTARCNCMHAQRCMRTHAPLHAHPCSAACSARRAPPRPPHPSPLFADDVSVLLQEIITEARNLSNAEM